MELNMLKYKRSLLLFIAAISGLLAYSYIEHNFFTKSSPTSHDLDYIILRKENNFGLSPIGDNLHTEVYTFIKSALLASKPWSQADIQQLRDNEIKFKEDKSYKPFIADIYEGELATLLRILRNATKCNHITLYQKDGVGIATTGSEYYPDYSVLMSPRKVDFEIGILSPDTMKEPKLYTYETHDSGVCYEFLKAIYYHKDRNSEYAYIDPSKRQTGDELIGYVSYIVLTRD
jgi:hypothetical protein